MTTVGFEPTLRRTRGFNTEAFGLVRKYYFPESSALDRSAKSSLEGVPSAPPYSKRRVVLVCW